MSSVTTYFHLSGLDGLELLQAADYARAFPWHQHDTFNISLITSGTESIRLPDTTVYAPAGHLSITHPEETHANPLLHAFGLSFFTFYASPNLLRYLAGGRAVRFPGRVIHNPPLFAQLWKLARQLEAGQGLLGFEQRFSQVLAQLIRQHGEPVAMAAAAPDLPASPFTDLTTQLSEQLEVPVSLTELARRYNMDKFRFLRLFKLHTGLTPHSFVLMKRVEQAKLLLREGSSLVEAALSVGFYDQAHFSRFFRSFVGVSPGRYQRLPPPPPEPE